MSKACGVQTVVTTIVHENAQYTHSLPLEKNPIRPTDDFNLKKAYTSFRWMKKIL